MFKFLAVPNTMNHEDQPTSTVWQTANLWLDSSGREYYDNDFISRSQIVFIFSQHVRMRYDEKTDAYTNYSYKFSALYLFHSFSSSTRCLSVSSRKCSFWFAGAFVTRSNPQTTTTKATTLNVIDKMNLLYWYYVLLLKEAIVNTYSWSLPVCNALFSIFVMFVNALFEQQSFFSLYINIQVFFKLYLPSQVQIQNSETRWHQQISHLHIFLNYLDEKISTKLIYHALECVCHILYNRQRYKLSSQSIAKKKTKQLFEPNSMHSIRVQLAD
jgi:hypothetical protein